ncbi:MAG: hypothetical protein V1706_15430 [Pseudomonadota bacterium]
MTRIFTFCFENQNFLVNRRNWTKKSRDSGIWAHGSESVVAPISGDGFVAGTVREKR